MPRVVAVGLPHPGAKSFIGRLEEKFGRRLVASKKSRPKKGLV